MQGNNQNNTQGNSAQDKTQPGLSWTQPASGGAPAGQKQNASSAQQPKPVQSSVSAVSAQGSKPSRRIGLIAGGIILATIVLGILLTGGSDDAPAAKEPGNVASAPAESPANAGGVESAAISANAGDVAVPDGQAAGLTVAVTSATVSAPTWLVVYESNGSQPGRALGATLFFPANNGKPGTISLLRATQSGQTYLIGKNLDGGDKVFSLYGDEKVVGTDGKPVWYTFTTR